MISSYSILKKIVLSFCLLFLWYNCTVFAQSSCIQVSSEACVGDCLPVSYVGPNSTNASYDWSIDCGTITNPTLQNPHDACFLKSGLCSIQLITQEPGQMPETCTVQVMVHPIPLGQFSPDDSLCLGDCKDINLRFTGTPPFRFGIKDNSGVNYYTSFTNGYQINVCPTASNVYELVELKDQFCNNANPATSVKIKVLPALNGSIVQTPDSLCAFPSGMDYTWISCSQPILYSKSQCFRPPQSGCYCVIIDNGTCKDTVCTTVQCNLTCSFDFQDTITVGDTALIYYTGNGSNNKQLKWTLDIPGAPGTQMYTGDSIRVPYLVPGCYLIRLNVKDGSCEENCSATICVVSKPCKCDTFNTNTLKKISVLPNGCCFNLGGKISSYHCYNNILISLNDGTFSNIQPNAGSGWSFVNVNSKTFYLNHNSGFLPPGKFNAADFCVQGAGQYSITVYYLSTSGGKTDSCTYQYVQDCPANPQSVKCDTAFSSFLEKQYTLPSSCCYDIKAENPNSNLFTKIEVIINGGTFSSRNANSTAGFFLTPSAANRFFINHNSGFIPSGSIKPGSFCINTNQTPAQVFLRYHYTTPQGKDSCSFEFLVECPGIPVPNTCCDSLKNVQLLSFGPGSNCCFNFSAFDSKTGCFSKICFKTSSGNFSQITPNPLWTVQNLPDGFCFIPNGGLVPSGNILPGTFCVNNAVNPFTVTVDFFDPSGKILDACRKTFIKNCTPPPKVCKCDSIKTKIIQSSGSNGECCYTLSSQIKGADCFSSIQLSLSSGKFTKVIPDPNYDVIGTDQKFDVTHNSGFIPEGIHLPVSFCVIDAALYTITVKYFFFKNGIKDSCVYAQQFGCTQPPKFCSCDSLKTKLQPLSSDKGICCFVVDHVIPGPDCFTSLKINVSKGIFTRVIPDINLKYNGNASQILLTHISGYLPAGPSLPVSFCVENAAQYTITRTYYYSKQGKLDSCVYHDNINCPQPPTICSCDSLQHQVIPVKDSSGTCCYKLNQIVPQQNCFNLLKISINSGTFDQVMTNPGWNFLGNDKSVEISHQSGFFPIGASVPVNFCVKGSSSYTIALTYYFASGGKLDSCFYQQTFNCAQPPSADTSCTTSVCIPAQKSWKLIGQTGQINDLCTYQCKLYAAGNFTQIGTESAQNIAVWDGHSWSSLGTGTNGPINALAVHNGLLFAGGKFTEAGGLTDANNIAVWNGNSWSKLDNGVLDSNGLATVNALLSHSSGLIVGGVFKQAGNLVKINTQNIARWNGTNWEAPYMASFNGPVNTLGLYQNQLYAGGVFSIPNNNISVWNGLNWSNLLNGINLDPLNKGQGVSSLKVFNGKLILGGRFENANGVNNTKHIAQWNGIDWSQLSGGDFNTSKDGIYDLKNYDQKLYAAGNFMEAGMTPMSGVAEWDSLDWNNTAHLNQIVRALESYDSCGTKPCDLFSAGDGFVNDWGCINRVNESEISGMDIKIRPNPAKDELIIQFDGPNSSSLTRLNILNMNGQLIKTFQIHSLKDQKIEVSDLSQGVYMLDFRDESGNWKIIKLIKL
ncbi:MAG: T9SS type A sorting domain-containing protein [Saprospiraceae bacterium]|nr:T9SS type A sorting domain-containing protein [Candidatus Vicinibacter affinis]